MSNIVSYLFKTNAIKFCPENQPFWYTSGKIGPYFINTHFVYGSENEAKEFLSYIDNCLESKMDLPQKIFEKILKQYEENNIYRDVINTMKTYIENNIDINQVDYISGGERRDWFFSNILAYLLKKPHITIYKDLTTVVSPYDFSQTDRLTDLADKNVLHITDLVTVASSFLRAWIPAIRNLGGNLVWTCYVVDRKQGGTEKIKSEKIKVLPLVNVDKSLFEHALNNNIINDSQFDMLNKFFDNPDDTMREFLLNHPEFLENSLNSDEKTRKRAKLLIDGNLYGIN